MTNGLCTIHLAGQEVKLLFGMPAIRQLSNKMLEFNLIDGNGHYNEAGYTHIIYAGYCNHCIATQSHPVIEFIEFFSFVEDAILSGKPDEIKAAVKCFDESRVVQDLLKKAGDSVKESKKKNSPGMKSKPSVTESLDLAQANTGG